MSSTIPIITRTATAPAITAINDTDKLKTSSPPIVNQKIIQQQFKLSKQRPLNFRARLTQFDLSNPDRSNDTFRGFYTLFWIAMGLYVIQAVVRCYEQEGILLSLNFFHLISKDGLGLLISDLTMVSMTLFSVLFSKLFVWNILPYETVGVAIQHVCQAIFLFVNIYWTFHR